MPLFHRAGIYLTLGMTVRRLFALRDVRPFSTKEYWLYLFPFTLHFGWITVIPPAVSQPHAASATGPSLFRSSCSAPTLKTSPKSFRPLRCIRPRRRPRPSSQATSSCEPMAARSRHSLARRRSPSGSQPSPPLRSPSFAAIRCRLLPRTGATLTPRLLVDPTL